MQARREELPSLTPLRGIAALVVLVHHCGLVLFGDTRGLPAIFQRGYLAPDLFFLLSGFVIAHVYLRRIDGVVAVRRFLWGRILRIGPANALATVTLGLLFLSRNVIPTGGSLAAQIGLSLVLMQVPWLSRIDLNGPSWSVSAEIYAYALFPLVAAPIARLKLAGSVALFAALLVFSACDRGVEEIWVVQQSWGWLALVRALPEFACGVVMYRLFELRACERLLTHALTLPAVLVAIIAALYLPYVNAVVFVLFVPLILSAVQSRGVAAALLNVRPLRWLGDISYSLYIFQMVPLVFLKALMATAIGRTLGLDGWVVIGTVVGLACGAAMHYLFDVPVRRRLRTLATRGLPVVTPVR